MADKTISQLTELVHPNAATDILPVMDISTNKTKKALLGKLPISDSAINHSYTFTTNITSDTATTQNLTGITTGNGFSSNSDLTSIYIGSAVTSISNSGFKDSENLVDVTLSPNITSIEQNTFQNCSGLTSVRIGDRVTGIGEDAFRACTSLTGITIPDGLTLIGDGAFHDCTGLISITIPESVTGIGDGAFENCPNLTNLTLQGKNVPSFGSDVFLDSDEVVVQYGSNNTLLASTLAGRPALVSPHDDDSIQLPSYDPVFTRFNPFFGLLTIIFNGNTNFVYKCERRASGSLTIPRTLHGFDVTSIGYEAFRGCSLLDSVEIPDSVTEIAQGAFTDCFNLGVMTIPDGVQNIRDMTFFFCKGLRAVVLGSGVIKIGAFAFYRCDSLSSVTMRDNVEEIEFSAFQSCRSLTSITIPESVTLIEKGAFSNCPNLTSVTFKGDAPTFEADVFKGSNSVTILYDPNKSGFSSTVAGRPAVATLTFTLNGGGTEYSVTDCDTSLVGSVEIPSTYNGLPVTSIGNNALADCFAITSVTIGDNVTSIGDQAFAFCRSMESVTIGNSVTSIGALAFQRCDSLTNVTIPNSVTTITFLAFASCGSLRTLTIGSGVTSIGDQAFKNCVRLSGINSLATSAPTLGENAFQNIAAQQISVPSGATASYRAAGYGIGGNGGLSISEKFAF